MRRFARARFFLAAWWANLAVVALISALGRLALWIFPAEAGGAIFSAEAGEAWNVGARFDLMTGAYLSLPILSAWLVALAFPRKRSAALRCGLGVSLALDLLLVGVWVADFGFFGEYGDQFNVWALGVFNDDAGAIFGTVLADYHWGRYLAAFVAGTALCAFAIPRLNRAALRFSARRARGVAGTLVLFAATLVCAAFCFRGGFARRPLGLRDAAVCATDKLNRLIVNPAFLLKHVFLDMREISNGGARPAFVHDVPEQARRLFGTPAETPAEIEALVTKKNRRLNPNAPAPKRVYLFVMESYDAWPLAEKYAPLGLADSVAKLRERGASSENFISGASGTMLSLSALMSGVPHVDVAQNYRPNGSRALATATAKIFSRLGYRTRFAYCGYGMWQHVETYARDQGFDEVVLGSDVADCPETLKGEWGVPDGFLFERLAKLARADGDAPVFTLVLSASYHPPYNLPLDDFGCPPVVVPAELADACGGRATPNELRHFRYADRALGKFVEAVGSFDPNAVFAVTGDHFSRRFIGKNPTLAERKQVPFVVAGGGVPAGTKLPFGTHADVVPTLLALCAPEGFEYASFGENLFSEAARSRRCAFGENVVLHAGGGFLYGSPDERYGAPVPPELAAEMTADADALRALAWTYFEKTETPQSR